MPEPGTPAAAVRRRDFLELFPLFGQDTGHLLDELLMLLRRAAFEDGQQIYREQDACSGISFLLSGEIRVFKRGPGAREVTLYTIGPGEICILNAACILSGTHYPANAVALSAGSVYALSAGEFRRLVDKYPLMRQFVLHGLSGRLFGIMHLVEEVLFRRMDERLLKYLSENAREGVLERTHQQIANDLGTSREVVSRLLGDLAAGRRIEVSRQHIRLLKGL